MPASASLLWAARGSSPGSPAVQDNLRTVAVLVVEQHYLSMSDLADDLPVPLEMPKGTANSLYIVSLDGDGVPLWWAPVCSCVCRGFYLGLPAGRRCLESQDRLPLHLCRARVQ